MLAKMEGNLDTLTALLREIRETSDVIEAAWLRFTEQRLVEGPMPKTLPGTTLGIPLLASRIEDKSRVNQGLRDGVSRREKRNIAAAVNELLTVLRYHVLLQAERTGDHQKRDRHPEGSSGEDPRSAEAVEAVLRDFQEAGYDLSGIENESLHTAAEREWKRRAQLWDQKIWIFTTATARRLAAQSQELQDAERDFYKVRLDILKDEAEKSVQQQEAAARRSVALGRVKEEMYHQLSDLLEKERMATFQKWIRRIVEQLDQKRLEIHTGWARGEINRRTLFYLLRRHQKDSGEPTWRDVQSFLKAHWFEPLAELRKSGRPDRDERIRDLDARFRGVLGASLLALEEEAAARAENEVEAWIEDQLLQVYN
jgi:hypothetical protein